MLYTSRQIKMIYYMIRLILGRTVLHCLISIKLTCIHDFYKQLNMLIIYLMYSDTYVLIICIVY